VAGALAVAAELPMMQRRTLKLKATFESGSSHFRFKR
jgi:hypothetical protein